MIASQDPFAHPKITANYLSTEYDRRIIVEGLKMVRRIVQAPAFARYVEMEREPGDETVSDEDLLAYARKTGDTIFHPTSTCRMGSDPNAVVDARLRVHGLAGRAHRRLLDHAEPRLRQHQRRCHHDRREVRANDFGGCWGEGWEWFTSTAPRLQRRREDKSQPGTTGRQHAA